MNRRGTTVSVIAAAAGACEGIRLGPDDGVMSWKFQFVVERREIK